MGSFNTFTSALGASLMLYVSYKLLDTTRLYTRPSGLHRYLYTNASGRHAWALITGSSNGIGKCLAFELAGHGFNIVIHGRNADKLEGVRNELRAVYPGVEVRVVVADASQCHRRGAVDFERIREQLADLHLTVLINCAGAGPKPAFGALETYERDDILENLHLNAAFPTLLTATLMPVLRGKYRRKTAESTSSSSSSSGNATESSSTRSRRLPRRPALIINIGSVTDDGFPLVSFYSAGKAATHALHKALAREAALDGWDEEVEIISHRVGAVTGVSHTEAPATLFRPAARTIARAVLARTGCGRNIVVPYWPHALQQGLLALLPAWILDRIINTAMREERRVQDEEARKGP
ncbi:short chain dehydrogenase/reductase [Xylaria acuta]|nr:short chain dehydrogenase/reductase [Xylaria acuta]